MDLSFNGSSVKKDSGWNTGKQRTLEESVILRVYIMVGSILVNLLQKIEILCSGPA